MALAQAEAANWGERLRTCQAQARNSGLRTVSGCAKELLYVAAHSALISSLADLLRLWKIPVTRRGASVPYLVAAAAHLPLGSVCAEMALAAFEMSCIAACLKCARVTAAMQTVVVPARQHDAMWRRRRWHFARRVWLRSVKGEAVRSLLQMVRLRRDFKYNLRLLDARDEELAAAEAATAAATREMAAVRDEAARTRAALEEAQQGARLFRTCLTLATAQCCLVGRSLLSGHKQLSADLPAASSP